MNKFSNEYNQRKIKFHWLYYHFIAKRVAPTYQEMILKWEVATKRVILSSVMQNINYIKHPIWDVFWSVEAWFPM